MKYGVVGVVVWLGVFWASTATAQPACRGVDCDGVGTCFPERGVATCLCDAGYEAVGAGCIPAVTPIEPLRERHRSDVGEEVVAVARAQVGLGPHRVGRRFNGDIGPLHEFLAPHEMWCTDFVAWVYRAAGVPFDGGRDGWQVQNNFAARAWFQQRDLWVDRNDESWQAFEPRAGDYVRIHTARFGHSAIVTGVEGDTLFTIEGNVGNRVRFGRHPRFKRDPRIDGFGILALDNAPPAVDAGPGDLVAWGDYSVYLEGAVTDDGPDDQLTVSWSRRDGPGNVSFEDPWSSATWATFSEPGVYVLRLAADDGSLSATDDIVVELVDDSPDAAEAVTATLSSDGSCAVSSVPSPRAGATWSLLLLAVVARLSRRR